jgi:hypothetical protein
MLQELILVADEARQIEHREIERLRALLEAAEARALEADEKFAKLIELRNAINYAEQETRRVLKLPLFPKS